VTKATWPTKADDVAFRHVVHHLQYISWFDVSDNRRKSMNHWPGLQSRSPEPELSILPGAWSRSSN